MPRDVLPEKLTTPSRDDIVQRYERDWRLRNPGARVGEGTEPGTKARILADLILPLYGEASRVAQLVSLGDMDDLQLEDEAERLGLPRRLPAAGGAGSVSVRAATGGGTIFAGDELRNDAGVRFQCAATRVYVDGDAVPIVGIDTGPATNLDAGVTLKWTSPRPGIAQEATVVMGPGGVGLTGGRDAETADEIRERIRSEKASPAAAGNDADYRRAALRTPNLAIQAAFTYPAIKGPGTMGLAFTMRPLAPGGSRIPSDAQRLLVSQAIVGSMPGDDGLINLQVVDAPIDMRLRVRWAQAAPGWTDLSPWPVYSASYPVYVDAVTSALNFRLAYAVGGSHAAPVPGQTLALWDGTARRFRRKRVKTVSAGPPWVITCDGADGVSDTTFVPAIGEALGAVGPWSDSLDALVLPIVTTFDALGPGESVVPFDEGLRQRRSPSSEETYPSTLTGRVVTPIFALPAVADVQCVSPTLPYETPVGAAGVSVRLLRLRSLLAYAL